ncbi:MAG: MaoC family dehydratase [Armatimonadetes bacterium]|nr:MaoC family dehydratase [Armatimonadota bacterium]
MKNKIQVGDRASIKKAFNENEVLQYAKLSEDTNPIHFDADYAKNTIFKNRIVHGMLVGSLFGGLLGSKLPGRGTIHLGQTLNFKKPVYVGEEVTAIIEVIKIRSDKPIITFRTLCLKNNNEISIEGTAVVKVDSKIIN